LRTQRSFADVIAVVEPSVEGADPKLSPLRLETVMSSLLPPEPSQAPGAPDALPGATPGNPSTRDPSSHAASEASSPVPARWKRWLHSSPLLVSIAAGALYGILAQISIRVGWDAASIAFASMSVGFIFLLPVALGAFTVWASPEKARRSWLWCSLVPWLTATLCLIVALLVGWEGTLCLIMAVPVYLPMASVGGLVMGGVLRYLAGRGRNTLLSTLALLPFVSAYLELDAALPQRLEPVDTRITIQASPAVVWQNIIRVPAITPGEQGDSLFYSMGFPRPVEATLSHEGVGGVRHASFERGLVFVETVSAWEPERLLSFTIQADPNNIPLTTLDSHVTVGGLWFDVLDGTYRIEALSDREVVLHLSSTHRISTRFNFYAGLWSRYLMRDVQTSILNVLKDRCEAQQSGETRG